MFLFQIFVTFYILAGFMFQVLIVGNGAVGKSSMIQRYCRGTFTKSYKKTIGVDFLEKQLRVHGEDVRQEEIKKKDIKKGFSGMERLLKSNTKMESIEALVPILNMHFYEALVPSSTKVKIYIIYSAIIVIQ